MTQSNKKGIVLFVTLMMIMLLLAVVSIFLNKTKESKDNITYERALVQTNLIMQDLLSYLKKIKFDEDMIYYAAKAPFPLGFDNSNVIIKIDSAQKYIDINSLIKDSVKNNITADKFVSLLYRHNISQPELLLNILQDTIDTDIEDKNSGLQSEIILSVPTFRNGKVYNKMHLDIIIDYYFNKTGDNQIYNFPFSDIFGYSNSMIDMNFVSMEVMNILFEDANSYLLEIIAEHKKVYDKLEDLPFDDYYTKKIKKPILGHSISTTTSFLKIHMDLNYKTQFKSTLSFDYNINSKGITNYSIEKIELVK